MHLYVHVPFCARRCSYCDFAIAVRRQVPDQAFADAILREWEERQALPSWQTNPRIDTIYFGGGTPSLLDPLALQRVLSKLGADREIAQDAEITLEANPDDVSAARAAAWARGGVNRVSLGVQSHDPAVLQWMHRTHRSEQVPAAMAMLRAAGLHNISVDLIFALPPEVPRDWQEDLERTFALEPSHISLYGLTVESRTPLARWTERGEVSGAPDERYASEYLAAAEQLERHGFEQYEVSNAGQPGRRSRHNSAYWSGAEYLGLGPSAHSFLAGVRSWNCRDWAEYQRRSVEALPVEEGREVLDEAARALERQYLGLRTRMGLPIEEIPPQARDQWLAAGWATGSGGRLRLTPEGWLRLDALVGEISHS
jgi:oxygen-independent coproporphyrinogen-3 oxidase